MPCGAGRAWEPDVLNSWRPLQGRCVKPGDYQVSLRQQRLEAGGPGRRAGHRWNGWKVGRQAKHRQRTGFAAIRQFLLRAARHISRHIRRYACWHSPGGCHQGTGDHPQNRQSAQKSIDCRPKSHALHMPDWGVNDKITMPFSRSRYHEWSIFSLEGLRPSTCDMIKAAGPGERASNQDRQSGLMSNTATLADEQQADLIP